VILEKDFLGLGRRSRNNKSSQVSKSKEAIKKNIFQQVKLAER